MCLTVESLKERILAMHTSLSEYRSDDWTPDIFIVEIDSIANDIVSALAANRIAIFLKSRGFKVKSISPDFYEKD